MRFEAGWRAFEALRLEGATGPAIFLRDYFDPMMREVTGPDGPFHLCAYISPGNSRNKHEVPLAWPAAEAPEGLFRDERADGRSS
jgi:hypothetical protein